MSDTNQDDETLEAVPARTPAFVLTKGGDLSAEELAAVAVALTPGNAEEPDVDDRRQRRAWNEAALLEGVGFRPFVSVDDVERYHRSIA